MSQSQAVQTEIDPNAIMTPTEAKQLDRIETMINLAAFFKGAWECEHLPSRSRVVQNNHHKRHGKCSGHLQIVEVIGKPVYRHAIARLIARAPSMANLLEKVLPIIKAEVEMRQLANEIEAEINMARGLNETIQR